MVPIHGGQRRDLRNVTVTLASAPFWSEKHTFHLSRHLKFHLKSKQDIEKRKRGHPLNLRTNFIETSIFNGEQRGTDGQSINWIWLPIKFLAVNCWIRSSFIMLLTWGIVSKMLLNGQIYWSFRAFLHTRKKSTTKHVKKYKNGFCHNQIFDILVS